MIGLSQAHKWENCFTIDKKSWGYRRNVDFSEYYTTSELIATLVTTVSVRIALFCNSSFKKNKLMDLFFVAGRGQFTSKYW